MFLALVLSVQSASALRSPSGQTLRVVIADVGNEVAWFPGDRRVLKSPTPSQQAALSTAAIEELVLKGKPARRGHDEQRPLVVMIPAVDGYSPAETTHRLAHGGGGRRVYYTAGKHDEGSRREAQGRRATVNPSCRIAALCAVSRVRTAGKAAYKGVSLQIASAWLEVIGRVAIGRMEAVRDEEATALVANNAVVQDAWIDEIGSSPVHALHALRRHADECARLHDMIRTQVELDIDLDRPLFELAETAAANAAKICTDDRQLRDAYGDLIHEDPELETLRAVSFAAWRVLRCFPETPADDIAWAFNTRFTLDRLQRAEHLFRSILDSLDTHPPPFASNDKGVHDDLVDDGTSHGR